MFTFSCEVFDYLLSLPDYPIEFENDGETALMISLTGFVSNDIWMREHFAYELIKKGACFDKIARDDRTLFHHALERSFGKVAKLLLEKGFDINLCDSPLELADEMENSDDCVEVFLMLLMLGADPTDTDSVFTIFEASIRSNRPHVVQEALFYYTYDEFSLIEIHLEQLLQLAANDSPLFYEITKRSFEIKVHSESANSYFNALCSVDPTRLKTIITKLESSIELFLTLNYENGYNYVHTLHKLSLENLNLFLECSLKDQMITFINSLQSTVFISSMGNTTNDESLLTKYTLYLLSYGLEIVEYDLHYIYFKYGYCDLFKILLHMDFQKENPSELHFNVMPIFIINVTESLQYLLDNYCTNLNLCKLKEVVSYFSHPTLHSMYERAISEENEKTINLPQIPCLVELARNVFRSYFVNRLQIKTTKEFYTLLNSLRISPVHKEIISYETKLYNY